MQPHEARSLHRDVEALLADLPIEDRMNLLLDALTTNDSRAVSVCCGLVRSATRLIRNLSPIEMLVLAKMFREAATDIEQGARDIAEIRGTQH
jgi:hypothetical protein